MIALVRSASVCSLLILLSGCDFVGATHHVHGIYPSPDCASNPDHPIDSIVTYTPPPSTMTELANQSDLVVMGTVIAEGSFGMSREAVLNNAPYRTILRYYTFQVDTYHKGQGAGKLPLYEGFNFFAPGSCRVDQAMLARNFRPGYAPQFGVGERYLLFLNDASSRCSTPCYTMTALTGMLRINSDQSIEMLIPPDAGPVVNQSFNPDGRPLREQVDEALRQLSAPAPTATSLP